MLSSRPLAALLLLVASAAATVPEQAPEETMIRYHVSLPERQAHRVDVRMSLDGLAGDVIELSLPVWTPGSYLVREYARHVIELRARTPDGRSLAADKVAKDAWRIGIGGSPGVIVEYRLYANEVSVRTSHVDSDHAHLHPAATFLRHGPSAGRPHRVEVELPPGWRAFTALDPAGDAFQAADYDELIDSPIELGPHDELTFVVEGVPHRLVLAGKADVDHDALRADVARLCAEVATVFGQMPFDDYTFLLGLVDAGGGGLEHKDSSVCLTNRWTLGDPAAYRRLLSLLAHEYFHAWNVKRFRPVALGPFAYDRENYTPDLWVAEGLTSYYDDLCTLRAGFADQVGDYLKDRATAFRKEAERPGGQVMSLTRSSMDAWIKHYRPDENSLNSSISYYTKGALVGLLLDLRIRAASAGRKTLADALRLGWERFAARDVGYPPGTMQALAGEVAGRDLSEAFAAWVDGTAPLEPDADLAYVGLRLLRKPEETKRRLPVDAEGFALEPWLGLTTRASNGLAQVDVVLEGGPAHRAGLNHDDLLLALDGLRVDEGSLADRLDRLAGQDAITVTFFRGQELRSVTVEPELRRLVTWALESVESPTEAQREAFREWTAWAHPSEKEGGWPVVAAPTGEAAPPAPAPAPAGGRKR